MIKEDYSTSTISEIYKKPITTDGLQASKLGNIGKFDKNLFTEAANLGDSGFDSGFDNGFIRAANMIVYTGSLGTLFESNTVADSLQKSLQNNYYITSKNVFNLSSSLNFISDELLYVWNLKAQEILDDEKAMSILCDYIYDLIAQGKFNIINNIFGYIIFFKFKLKISLCLLMLSSNFKERIELRFDLLRYANSLANDMGMNPDEIERLLKGI